MSYSKLEKLVLASAFTVAAMGIGRSGYSIWKHCAQEVVLDKKLNEIKAETAAVVNRDTIYTEDKDYYRIKETTVYDFTNAHFNKINIEKADEIKKKTMLISAKTGDTIYRLKEADIDAMKPSFS